LQHTWDGGVAVAHGGLPPGLSSLLGRKEKLADQEHPKLSHLNPPEPVCQGLNTTAIISH